MKKITIDLFNEKTLTIESSDINAFLEKIKEHVPYDQKWKDLVSVGDTFVDLLIKAKERGWIEEFHVKKEFTEPPHPTNKMKPTLQGQLDMEH